MKKNFFCALGPFCWGVGSTAKVAIRNAKKEWPSYIKAKPLVKNFTVYATDGIQFHVSDLGDIGVRKPFKIEVVQRSAISTIK